MKTVYRVRAEEVHVLLKAALLKAVNEAIFFVQPAVISCMVFATYHLLGNVLKPQQVSSALVFATLDRGSCTSDCIFPVLKRSCWRVLFLFFAGLSCCGRFLELY